MSVLESSIEKRVCQIASDMGVTHIKLTIRGQNGWPDRMFFIPGGKALFIEFKRPGEKLRPLQEHRASVLRRLGYSVGDYDNVEDAVNHIKKCLLEASRVSKKGNQVSS